MVKRGRWYKFWDLEAQIAQIIDPNFDPRIVFGGATISPASPRPKFGSVISTEGREDTFWDLEAQIAQIEHK